MRTLRAVLGIRCVYDDQSTVRGHSVPSPGRGGTGQDFVSPSASRCSSGVQGLSSYVVVNYHWDSCRPCFPHR